MPIIRGSRVRSSRPVAVVLALGVLVLLAGCVREPAASGPFPRFAEYQDDEVDRVTFAGGLRFPTDSLRAIVQTRPSRRRFLFLPFCVPFTGLGREEYRLDLNDLARDVVRLQLYHRDHGYYGAQVVPTVDATEEDKVAVEFAIAPGRQVILRDLAIVGADTILSHAELAEAIPLKEGEPFGRFEFLASADTIRARLLQRGHAYANVLRNYGLDTIAGVAEAEFVAIPGPVVFVDTVIISGNERLSDRTLRRLVMSQQDSVLRAVDLDQSQRNLYNLDMVNFASVRIAPDTLQVSPDVQRATILVEVVEAAQFAMEASAGFGTVDCVRASGRWINRNFIGGGRRLEISGSTARLGVGAPVNLGFESVCTDLEEEGFFGLPGLDVKDQVDYSLVADFQQPNVLGTENRLAVNLHNERMTEVRAYIRESVGGRVAAVRELEGGPTVLTTTFEAERGRTIASPQFLCVGFDTCTEEDLDVLSRYRWSNSLSLAAVRDAQWTDGTMSRGYILRGGLDWASSLLLSDDTYLRVLTEGAYFHPLKPGWVLAANLRYGRFLSGILGEENGYIPPERRFYAGGPSSVRGFARNALGPTTYIQTGSGPDERIVGSATGGTQMIVSSLELRMPSPWMADVMRAAVFVDAGHVSVLKSDLFRDTGLRFTPGVGLRFLTPVGPFRFDLAYNPYPRERGPLYILDPGAGLFLDDPSYAPKSPSFLGRFRIQFALGQAF